MTSTSLDSVVDLSVYNALDLTRRDQTAAELAQFLQKNWAPAPAVGSVTVRMVVEAFERLRRMKALTVSNGVAVVPRQPSGRVIRKLRMNDDRTGLQWAS